MGEPNRKGGVWSRFAALLEVSGTDASLLKIYLFYQCLESRGNVKVNVSFISDKFEKVGGEQAAPPLFLGNQDNKEAESLFSPHSSQCLVVFHPTLYDVVELF